MTVKPTEERNSVIVDLQSEFNSFSTFSPIKKYTVSMERVNRVKTELASTHSPSQEILLYFKSEYNELDENDLNFFLASLQKKWQAASVLSSFLSEEILRILHEKPEDMGRRLYRLLRSVDALQHNEECNVVLLVASLFPLSL